MTWFITRERARESASTRHGKHLKMPSPLIQIKNATVYRGQTRVFKDLSLDIHRRQSTALLGPNGAGKTTFLKLLSREVYPLRRAATVVRLFGREKWNVWELRARLGIVSSDLQHHYAGNASGLNVALSGYHSSVNTWGHQSFSAGDVRRAEAAMEELGVAHLRDKKFAAMSTGEQRRFLLARALINRPDTLVLDEPTSGLDLPATFFYLNLVRKLMRDGRHTVLLVTHHLHEIPPEINRVVLLKNGAVTADGDSATILTSQNISALFDTPVRIVTANGFYQALPG